MSKEEIMIVEEWLGYCEYENFKYCDKNEIEVVKAVGKLLRAYNKCNKNNIVLDDDEIFLILIIIRSFYESCDRYGFDDNELNDVSQIITKLENVLDI